MLTQGTPVVYFRMKGIHPLILKFVILNMNSRLYGRNRLGGKAAHALRKGSACAVFLFTVRLA